MRKYYQSLIIAIGLAMMVGCHTTSNGMDFFPMPSSDASITSSVQEAIQKNHKLSTSKIHVTTTNHVVVLSGHVRSIRQSDMAGELARKTPGVASVENNIIVRK